MIPHASRQGRAPWLAVAIVLAAAALLCVGIAAALIPSPDGPRELQQLRSPEASASSAAAAHMIAPARMPTAAPGVPAPSAPPATPPAQAADAEAHAAQVREDVRDQLAAKYEELRPRISAECFPSAGAPRVAWTYHSVVDAEGNEMGRGVSESRDGELPEEVRRCLHDHEPPMMKVDPPGQTVNVDVTVSWP